MIEEVSLMDLLYFAAVKVNEADLIAKILEMPYINTKIDWFLPVVNSEECVGKYWEGFLTYTNIRKSRLLQTYFPFKHEMFLKKCRELYNRSDNEHMCKLKAFIVYIF